MTNGCTSNTDFDYALDCPDPAGGGGGRSPGVLRVMLDTTASLTQRGLLLNELLRHFLHDTTATDGVDSAIAVLAAYGSEAYADIDAGLRVRANYPPTTNWRPAGATAVVKGTAHRITRSLYDDVRALLAPYNGNPTAIAAALRTDQAVQLAMLAIANDTTTWGATSAQAYLEQYLGYRYGPWYENPDEQTIVQRPLRTIGVALAPVATLYPNPTSEAISISYTLPAGSDAAEVLVVDALGKLCIRRSLVGTTGEATLSLTHLPVGIYTYQVLTSGAAVQTGKVVKLP